MRPHTLAGRRRHATLTRALTLVVPLALAAAGPLACASKGASAGAAHRNRMEAPPPFPSAPDFTVADATGVQRSLDALMGRKGLVLVLYRGHW